MKEKAIICGPFISENGWEILRLCPYCLWVKLKKYKNQNVKMIVYTRPDRFDLYGEIADVLVPLRIEGDYEKYKGNCFRLDGFPDKEYKKLIDKIYSKYKDQYDILEHIYPDVSKAKYSFKNQYPQKHMIHKFYPRKRNLELVNTFLNNNKKNIVLAPRFRKGFKRNWPHWVNLYDLIVENKLHEKYNFIICGKEPEYIKDPHNRLLDINSIVLDNDSSLIGVTIETIKKSVLTVGSQSAIPNLSLSVGTKVLEWGDQKFFHSKLYNFHNIPITFIEDPKYNIEPKLILKSIIKTLKKEI